MLSNIEDFDKVLKNSYDVIAADADTDIEGLKFVRYGIACKFIGEYNSFILKSVKNPKSEGEQISCLFVIELMNKMSVGFDKVRESVEIDEKISALSSVLVDTQTPAYDMIASTGLKVNFVQSVKNDFATINEFLNEGFKND